MLDIRIRTTAETERMLVELPKDWRNALVKGVRNATLFAEGKAKGSFGKHGNLKVGTGLLRRSIRSRVRERYNDIIGELSSNVIYAGIHEYGGTITAIKKPYLRFTVGGRWVQVKSVRMPARPFLYPAIADNIAAINDIITNTIGEELD